MKYKRNPEIFLNIEIFLNYWNIVHEIAVGDLLGDLLAPAGDWQLQYVARV